MACKILLGSVYQTRLDYAIIQPEPNGTPPDSPLTHPESKGTLAIKDNRMGSPIDLINTEGIVC